MAGRSAASKPDRCRTSTTTRSTRRGSRRCGRGCRTPPSRARASSTPRWSTARRSRIVEVEPKAVRFRILNAGNDRFLNLSLYVAADKNFPTTPGSGDRRPLQRRRCRRRTARKWRWCRSAWPRRISTPTRRAAFPTRRWRARAGGRSAPKAASCRSRWWCLRRRSATTSIRPTSRSASSTSTRCSSAPRNARMSWLTSAPTPARPSSSTTTPRRRFRPVRRRTTSTPATGTGWMAAARPTRSQATVRTRGR